MKEDQNRAILVELIKSLRSKGSWCGETHIQKAAYFLKHLTGVPIDFDFILYKHGPFSFELRDELSVMRAFDLLTLHDQYPYGPRMADTDMGDKLCQSYPKTLAKYKEQINYIADQLGDRGVAELERLATAYYVTRENPTKNKKMRADIIVKLKPHIKSDAAKQAVQEVDALIKQIEDEELRAA